MNGKSVINYTLAQCVKCMKCLKACPTGALSMHENRIQVNDEACISCGRCIRECHNRGILAHGSTLEDIKEYEYTICLVPTAFPSYSKTMEEASDFFHAVQLLGFDEVRDLSDIDAQIIEEANLIAQSSNEPLITSFCPVINRLIFKQYDILLDNIIPINYSSEIAAKKIREEFPNKKVGIFLLCECESKIGLAKYPLGNFEFEVDHALALSDILPLIRVNMGKGFNEVAFSKRGLQSCNPNRIVHMDTTLVADGFDKVTEILNMCEFGLLNEFKLLILFPCFNGCLGGHMMWGNSFSMTNNIDALNVNYKPPTEYLFDDLYTDQFKKQEEAIPFSERVQYFKQLNAILDELPGYDCSACGLQTCRYMAEEILKGNKTIQDCHILQALEGNEK